MKKIFFFVSFLLTVSNTVHAQSPYLAPFLWQKTELSFIGKAQDRSGFPVLLTDSVYCSFYSSQPPYQLTDEIYESYEYNNQERVVKYNRRSDYLPDVGDWNHTTYTLDAQGRVIASLTLIDVGLGNTQNSQKSETTYSPDGTTSEETRYLWDGSSWLQYSRNLRDYDAQGRRIQEIIQNWDGLIWTSYGRVVNAWDANNNQTLYRNESWDVNTNVWYIVYENLLDYDNDSKLLSRTTGTGSLGVPYQPSEKSEYHYDAQGRNDYIDYFDWDSFLSDWTATGKDVNTFNAQDEFEYTIHNTIVNQQIVAEGRTLYTYGESVYTDQPEVWLYQTLESGTFKDEENSIADYSDLPNGQVGLNSIYAFQDPPGSGDWINRIHCNVFFHVSTVSSATEPDKPAPCLAPNPYRAGTQVNCSGLKDNYSYMLWVYSLDGRVSYARQFNGAEGWSVERQLPTGAYLVVVTHNGKQISAQKIVFE